MSILINDAYKCKTYIISIMHGYKNLMDTLSEMVWVLTLQREVYYHFFN